MTIWRFSLFVKIRVGLALLLLHSAAGLGATPRGSTVAGRVVDQNGRPVGGATVTLSLVDQSGVFPSTRTDAQGRFVFTNAFPDLSAPHVVDVEAEKEGDLLISPRIFMLGFPAGGEAPRFLLHPSESVADLTVRFGPPGGRLVIRFEGDEAGAWLGSFKYRISYPGKSPPVDLAFRAFDVLLPAGDYELQILDLSNRFVTKVRAKVESGQTTEVLVALPPAFVPKETGQ